jgi:hypothetical protein
VLSGEGTKIWRDETVDKKFRNGCRNIGKQHHANMKNN